MLAYSSIAQAGYILIAIPVGAVALHSTSPGDNASRIAVAGLVGGRLQGFVYTAMKAVVFLVDGGTDRRGMQDAMVTYMCLRTRIAFRGLSMLAVLFHP